MRRWLHWGPVSESGQAALAPRTAHLDLIRAWAGVTDAVLEQVFADAQFDAVRNRSSLGSR
jgi:hypothetical protein